LKRFILVYLLLFSCGTKQGVAIVQEKIYAPAHSEVGSGISSTGKPVFVGVGESEKYLLIVKDKQTNSVFSIICTAEQYVAAHPGDEVKWKISFWGGTCEEK